MKRFKKIYVEICNVCNLSCDFCPGSRRAPAFMGKEAFARVLDAVSCYAGILCLHVMGEPLLHPDLADFLGMCANRGMDVNLTTNGLLLPERAQALLAAKALRQLNISLHSQACARNAPESGLGAYLEGIFSFCDQAILKGRPLVSLRLWNNEGGAANPDNRTFLEALSTRFGKTLPERPDTSAYAGIKLAPRVYLNLADSFSWPEMDAPDQGPDGFCHGLRDQIAILVDGRVTPCCLDAQGAIDLGNALAQDLGSILESPRARAIHQGFSERRAVEALCRHCSYKARFRKNHA